MSFDLTPPEPPETNILPMDENAEKVLEMQDLGRHSPYCENQCRNIWTDRHRRILICRDCGKAIEAFDYVLQWATDGTRRMQGIAGLKKQARIAAAELADLERRIDNVRGRLKRAGQPQPEIERQTFKRAMHTAAGEPLPAPIRPLEVAP